MSDRINGVAKCVTYEREPAPAISAGERAVPQKPAKITLAIELPSDPPADFYNRKVEIVFEKTLGEVAHDAYREEAGYNLRGYSDYATMPPHIKARWEKAAEAVAAKVRQ
jgi:hypothetical protein